MLHELKNYKSTVTRIVHDHHHLNLWLSEGAGRIASRWSLRTY